MNRPAIDRAEARKEVAKVHLLNALYITAHARNEDEARRARIALSEARVEFLAASDVLVELFSARGAAS